MKPQLAMLSIILIFAATIVCEQFMIRDLRATVARYSSVPTYESGWSFTNKNSCVILYASSTTNDAPMRKCLSILSAVEQKGALSELAGLMDLWMDVHGFDYSKIKTNYPGTDVRPRERD